MDALFAALDRDGDGIVTASEVEVCIIGRELSHDERVALVARPKADRP